MYASGAGLLEYGVEGTRLPWIRYPRRIAIALLCTCRQVYREAIESLYTSSTFVIDDDWEHVSVPQTLVYLPYFIQPQRLRQIRFLYINWRINPIRPLIPLPGKSYLAGLYLQDVWGPPVGYKVSEAWRKSWEFLTRMEGLQELYVRFKCDDSEKGEWLAKERELMDAVRAVKVKKRFVIVLPFVESNALLDGGESRCEFRTPSG